MEEKIRRIIGKAVGRRAKFDVTIPEKDDFGHYATNVALKLAAHRGQKPFSLALEIVGKLKKAASPDLFEEIEAVSPGFINFWIRKEVIQDELPKIARQGTAYGAGDRGKGKTAIFEFSDPNIAKQMHFGHLRATIIGTALANIYAFLGYRVIRWNYLGDWGTQFGNLIAAYKLWGKKREVERAPIKTPTKLYVRFHREAGQKKELEDMGRAEFRKLEEGDPENRRLWQWFKRESLKDFNVLYRRLRIRFDVWIGESFYEKDLKPLVSELKRKGVAKESQGSLLVPLEAFHLPPALVQKSDGASLYLTRDIANLAYRLKHYKPKAIFYVVGNEQTLHFEQLFAIAKLLHLDRAQLRHVKYGLVLGENAKKLKTREGSAVILEEVVEKAVRLARKVVQKKNPHLPAQAKARIAEAVGIGALKYNDLKEHRHSDILFDWQRMLDIRGESAPYLQYTYARLRSILRKAHGRGRPNPRALTDERELALIRKLAAFPGAVETSAETLLTSGLARYLSELATRANQYYEGVPILSVRGVSSSRGKDQEPERRAARLLLIESVAAVLRRGLELLGIETPEKI